MNFNLIGGVYKEKYKFKQKTITIIASESHMKKVKMEDKAKAIEK